MQQIFDLSLEEKKEIYNKAFTFKHDHSDHVETLMRESKNAVRPSGSDMFRPELWKGIHWNWFLNWEIN